MLACSHIQPLQMTADDDTMCDGLLDHYYKSAHNQVPNYLYLKVDSDSHMT